VKNIRSRDRYVEWSKASARSAAASILRLRNTMARTGFGLFLRALNVVTSFGHMSTPAMQATGDLKPGSYIIYDHRSKERLGLVITYASFFEGSEQCHEVVVIEEGHVITLLLWEIDRGTKWRVCSG